MRLRRQLWPHLTDADLWLRLRSKGFTTIPRTMPLILRIMDALSKGKPVASVYLDLWCRTFDECLVVLNKPTEMAFGSGFAGQRAEQTWVSRVRILSSLGFIDTQPGPSGPVSYAVLLNPYKVIMKHHRAKTPGMTTGLYNALIARANEIGAGDLMEQDPVSPTPNPADGTINRNRAVALTKP